MRSVPVRLYFFRRFQMLDRFRNCETGQGKRSNFLPTSWRNVENIVRGTASKGMIVRYDFKVKKCDGTTVVMQSVALPDMESLWSAVVALAQSVNEVGSRIIVTNEVGEIVILVGVAAASSFLNAPKEQKPTLTLRHIVGCEPQNDTPRPF